MLAAQGRSEAGRRYVVDVTRNGGAGQAEHREGHQGGRAVHSVSFPGFTGEAPLAAKLHVREYPLRPWVELEPTRHPLAVAQCEGISREDAIARAMALMHPSESP
ncbi:MAG: DUF2199 domain-containing protein [Myxococcota bacterium]